MIKIDKIENISSHGVPLNMVLEVPLSNGWQITWKKDSSMYYLINIVLPVFQCLSCGVPQVSILGPLLFLIYVNNMSNVSQLLFTLLFADDTNVFTIGKKVRQLTAFMNNEWTKIVEWLNVNKLSLNVKKLITWFVSYLESVLLTIQILRLMSKW